MSSKCRFSLSAFHGGAPQLNGYIKLCIAPHLLTQYTPAWEQSLVLPSSFQSSPGGTTISHVPSASILLPSKCSTKAGQQGSFQSILYLFLHCVLVPTSLQSISFTTQQDLELQRQHCQELQQDQDQAHQPHQFCFTPIHHFHPPSDSVQMLVDTYFTCTLSDTLWLRGRITGDHPFSGIPSVTLPEVLWQ